MTTRRSPSSVAALSAATHGSASDASVGIKIALIGCGGRGTGACSHALTAGPDIKLVALLGPLEGKAQAALDLMKRKHEGQVDVPPEQVFTRFEARVARSAAIVPAASASIFTEPKASPTSPIEVASSSTVSLTAENAPATKRMPTRPSMMPFWEHPHRPGPQ